MQSGATIQEGKGKLRSGSELVDVFEVSSFYWIRLCDANEFSLFSFLIKEKIVSYGTVYLEK